jgi:putative solute:sodium symporter small subunit
VDCLLQYDMQFSENRELREEVNMNDSTPREHRRACLRITIGLLVVWFMVSFVAAILCRDWLDASFPQIGNAPFGFWMAQQGSIICFVLILITYAVLMRRLDEKHGYSE